MLGWKKRALEAELSLERSRQHNDQLQRTLSEMQSERDDARLAAALLFAQRSGGGVYRDRISYREVEGALEDFADHVVVVDQYPARQVADVYIGPRVESPFEPTEDS
jgi:hypothetical protein